MQQPFSSQGHSDCPGEYALARRGNVVLITVRGRWDRRLVRSFADEYIRRFLPPILSLPWAAVADLRGLGPTPISAFFEVAGIQRWSWENNLSWQALVLPAGQSRIRFRELADIKNAERTRYFERPQEAVAWLASVGFPLEGDLPEEFE